MSYGLLWIEALLTSLLWLATWTACSAGIRRSRRWLVRLPGLLVFLIPFAIYGGLTYVTGMLKYSFHLVHNWFAYALSLLLAYCGGAIILFFCARRRSVIAPEISARSWPRGRLALGLAAAAAITCMTLWNMDLEVRGQAANLRIEAGAMMLSVAPPSLSDSQNSALLYEKAFRQLATDPQMVGPDSPFEDSIPNENHPVAAALLQRHAPAIKLLLKAATMPEGRFDHDYAHPRVTMLLPELTGARRATHLLWLGARYELAKGHVDSALGDLNAMFRLSHTIAGQPFLVNALVAEGLDNMAIEALQDVLPAIVKPEQLSGIDLGEVSDEMRTIARDFRGEEALGLSAFGDLAEDRMSLSMLQGVTANSKDTPNASPIDTPALAMLTRVFLVPDDEKDLQELFQRADALIVKPYYQIGADELAHLSTHGLGLVTQLIVQSMAHAMLNAARTQAMRADAQVAIAMTRFRLDHGNFPATLDLLVPAYLDEMPLDPFDGKPLRLTRHGGDWIVYSIGPDGKDDGGAPYDAAKRTGDLGFVLKQSSGMPPH